MAKEFRSTPYDLSEQEHDFQIKFALIDTINKEIEDKIAEINQSRKDPRNADETIDRIILNARKAQLNALADHVFEAVEYEETGILVDLDNPQMLTGRIFTHSTYFPLRKDYVQEAVKEGEKLGTDDFLFLLASPERDDVQKNLSFYPWRKSMAQRVYNLYLQEDKSLVTYLPTRIPDLEVELVYPPDGDLPKRSLILFEK